MCEFVVLAVWAEPHDFLLHVGYGLAEGPDSRMMPGASLAQADRNAASPSMDESIGTDGRRSVGAGVVDPEGVSTAAPAIVFSAAQ